MKNCFKKGLISLILLMIFPAFSIAEESGEELYRQGKFKEALDSFTRADMDNPKEVRFRYNRGCAAFENSDMDASEAAFASVLKRTDDKKIRFRSFYNKGVVAFKKGDFQSASQDFKEALKLDPSDEDAQYNFELSLRRKKQAEENKKQTQNESQESDRDQLKKNGNQSEKNDSRDGKESSRKQEPPNQNKEQDPADKKDKQNQRNHQPDKPREEPEDLSGELEGKEKSNPVEEKNQKTPPSTDSRMAEKKAKALLENVKDDRSILLDALKAQEKEAGKSGKKW
jgi:Ca-activated chloride channel family protein